MGMERIQKQKFKATTKSAHSLPVVEHLLDQRFTVSGTGRPLLTYPPRCGIVLPYKVGISPRTVGCSVLILSV